jgi:undecaprenyl-diphosphatase
MAPSIATAFLRSYAACGVAAWQACAHFPELAWVLAPLAGLIAASRVVLGLHYPTDVLAGAALGAGLAAIGLAVS